MNRWMFLGAIGLACGVAGCAVGPDYEAPDVPAPDAFVQHQPEASRKAGLTSRTDLAEWWKSLRDPELDSLVSRAIDSNLDLEIALTRLQEGGRRSLS